MENKRDAYWDNIKLVLIFLVVLGHFLLPVSNKKGIVLAVYNWIFLFHMPAFIFVSGYFSKNYVKKDKKEYKLLGFLAVFLLFTVCVWAVQLIFTGKFDPHILLQVSGAPWYMLTMFFWYLLIPFASRIKPAIAFPVFIILALIVGVDEECASFLAISRTIVFFPFFLAGYYFDKKLIDRIKPWMRVIGFLILVAALLAFLFFPDQLKDFARNFNARRPYSAIGFSNMTGIIYRCVWYVVVTVVISSLLCVIPNRHFCITYIGERTLSIYVIHRILRDITNRLGFYKMDNRHLMIILCLVLSVIVTYVASLKPFTLFFNRFFHLDVFFRKETK